MLLATPVLSLSFSFHRTLVALHQCFKYKGLTVLWCHNVRECMCECKGLSLTAEQWLYNVSCLSGQNGTWGGREETDPGELTSSFSQPPEGAAGIIRWASTCYRKQCRTNRFPILSKQFSLIALIANTHWHFVHNITPHNSSFIRFSLLVSRLLHKLRGLNHTIRNEAILQWKDVKWMPQQLDWQIMLHRRNTKANPENIPVYYKRRAFIQQQALGGANPLSVVLNEPLRRLFRTMDRDPVSHRGKNTGSFNLGEKDLRHYSFYLASLYLSCKWCRMPCRSTVPT